MYAVIESGGKQYKVQAGDVIALEKIPGEAGTTVSLDRVLLVGGNGDIKLGTPIIAEARVQGEILGLIKARKVIIFKHKRRKTYRRTRGHRQLYTQVRITDIKASAQSA